MSRLCAFALVSLAFLVAAPAQAQITINPTADAYVQGANNANKNFGTATQLKARTNATAAKNFDSYLKFDMSTVPAFSAVKLRLYAALSGNGSVSATISAVSNTTWGETTITWNNKPAVGAALASGTVTNKTFAWYELDVTGYLQSERAAGRNVVSLALRAPATSSLTVNANSRQASTNKPQLVFTLNAAPSVSLTSPADSAAGAPIALTAAAADSDGTITQVEFFHGGTNLIATVTAAPYTFNWTNVAAASYTLTAKATDNLGTTTTSSPVNIIVTAAPALHFIHPDHLNTPRVITNQAQQVVWRWDNDDPFGGNMANENPGGLGNFTCNLRFPGQYFDKETNLHYNYFRDYDPAIGRYIQSDPIGLDGGINTYFYAAADPIGWFDIDGLLTRPVPGAVRGPDPGAIQGGACGARRRSNGKTYEHTGVDLLAPAGASVVAPISGIIQPSGREGVMICAQQGTICCDGNNRPKLVCYRLVHVTPTVSKGRVDEGSSVATVNELKKPIPPHVHVERYETTCDGMKRKCPPFN